MAKSTCGGCEKGVSPLCWHCKCTVCGGTRDNENKRTSEVARRLLQCTVCKSVTHVLCVPGDADTVPLLQNGNFHCSPFCLFRCTLQPNASFSPSLSAVMEQQFEDEWNGAAQRINKRERDECDERPLIVKGYRRLRFRCWRNYFIAESAGIRHQRVVLPPHWGVDLRVAWEALNSPHGKAALLCSLHPSQHPVGSVDVVPDTKFIAREFALTTSKRSKVSRGTPTCTVGPLWNQCLSRRTQRWLALPLTEVKDFD